MILEQDKIKDYDVDGSNDLEGGEVGIDISNMGLFYDMMSKSIYSNAPGSIIRELVSNGFDAHAEIDVKKPVIIKGKYEEGDYYLSVQDFGVGISEDRFKKVYLKYLSSTKRHSNKYLGAMGLGSKSPFAYADVFYVLTRYDGIEYYYVMSKGQQATPNWDLLYKKPTTEENGTTVKFILEGGQYGDDWYRFQKEITNQLRYFDDVYVDGFGIENEYTILSYSTFMYRKDTKEENMHIALGKVTYPIDWDTLKRVRIPIPVGVKFEIGELMITSNRESIRYNDEAIDFINKKVDACIAELNSLATENVYDELEQVLKAIEDNRYSKFLRLTDDIKIKIGSNGYSKDNKPTFPINIPRPQWKPFKGTPIVIPSDPFFLFKTVGVVDEYTKYQSATIANANRLLPSGFRDILLQSKRKVEIYRTNGFKINRLKLSYIGSEVHKERQNSSNRHAIIIAKEKYFHGSTTDDELQSIKKSKNSKVRLQNIRQVAQTIGLHEQERSPFVRQRINVTVPIIEDGWNKSKLIKLYRKEITKEIIKRSKSYDDLVVPEEYVKEYKASFVKTLLKGDEQQIPILNFGTNLETKVLTPLKTLKSRLVIYGSNADKNTLIALQRMLSARTWGRKNFPNHGKGFKIIGLNLTDVKKMTGENQISLAKFTEGHKVFREQTTAYFIYKKFQNIKLTYLFDFMPDVDMWSTKVSQFIQRTIGSEYSISSILESKYVQSILQLAEEQGLLIKEYVDIVNALEVLSEDMEAVKYIFKGVAISHETLTFKQKKEIAKFIVGKGYPVNPFYLFTPTEKELDWIGANIQYVYNKNPSGYVTKRMEYNNEDSNYELLLKEVYESRKSNNYSLFTPLTSWHKNFPLLSGSKSVKISTLWLTLTENQTL